MDNLSDLQCIKAILRGNNACFEVLINRHKNLIFTLCLKCLPTRELAEEAAQDTFLKAYNSLSSFKNQSKFSTWLYRICYFACMDYLKKKSVITEDVEQSTAIQVGIEADVLEKLAADERKAAITSAMNKLPQEVRFVLTLYYYDDLTTEELSSVLGISINYAKQKLYRGRKQLEKILLTQAKELIRAYE